MAKPTLKHLTSTGKLETRQTARDYGYVVVGIVDADTEVAFQSKRDDYYIAQAEKSGNAEWHARTIAAKARQIAEIEAVRGQHLVHGWSGSLANAQKAADDNNRRWAGRGRKFYVEAVNGGVREKTTPVVEAPKAAAIVTPAPVVEAPKAKAPKAAKAVTREEWLNKALHGPIAKLLAAHGATVPADCRVSIGFPGGGSARKRIGECWPRSRSKDGVNEVFINPTIAEPSQLLDILLHEAIHAADDCKSGHKGFFAKTAKAAGLQGKMTATTAGPALKALIERWIAQLPALTHGALDISGRKKQGTRMIKVVCMSCGYSLRTTRQWIEVGLPTCCCGGEMGAEG